MSERGSTRTLSSIGDGEDYISSGTEVAIIEGLGKYREGKKVRTDCVQNIRKNY